MNETIAVALIVSVIAPLLMAWLLGVQRANEAKAIAKQKVEDRQADWDRQDEVASRVEKVATDAVEAQAATTKTLHDIHTLVNSDMTAARQAELTTTRLLLVALRRIEGADGDATTAEAITAAETRATELEQILADRLVAQRKVEADDAAATAGP